MDVDRGSAVRPPGLLSRDFALACAANLTFFGSMHYLLPALPLYIIQMGGQEADVGLLMGTFTLTSVALRPFVGRGVDSWRRKPFLLLGALIFVLASLAYNLTSSVPQLFLVRAFHGAGIACFTTAASTFIADIVPASRRGAAMGIYGTFSNVAMSIGPFLGGVLMRSFDMTVLFATSAATGLVSLAMVSLLREPTRHEPPARPLSAAPERRDYVSRSALFPSAVMFTLALTYGTVLSFLPLMAVSRGIAGYEVFFTVYALALIAVRAAGGSLSDRLGRAAVVIPGMVVVAGGMVLVATATSLTGLLVAAILYGLGFGAVNPSLMALTVDRCGLDNRGAAMATFSGSFDLGIGVGSVLLGFVLQLSDFGTMYLAAAGVVGVGLLIFVIGTRRGTRSASPGCVE